MILHRSIYFSADTALGLSMESYPCKNRNTKCAVYLTMPWSTGHFRVPKTFTFNFSCENEFYLHQNQGAKKIIFTACHSGKLKLAFTSPDVISTSPKNFLTSRIDFTVLLLFEFLKKHHLPIGQVKNRIHKPNSKIHLPGTIRPYFLCTLRIRNHFYIKGWALHLFLIQKPRETRKWLINKQFHFSRRHACKSTKQWGISKFQKLSLLKCYRLCTKPFLWKWVVFALEEKFIFILMYLRI